MEVKNTITSCHVFYHAVKSTFKITTVLIQHSNTTNNMFKICPKVVRFGDASNDK